MPEGTGRIFLSYRREETRHLAGRLADRLAGRFGSAQVFMDVDTIEPGVDFGVAITQAVGACDVLVVMIGQSWLTITDRHGRRKLDNPDDFVVLEIRAALDRNVRVIPVLVDGAHMPGRDDLPAVLHGLARRNAVRLDHETFRSDAGHLITAVEGILAAGPHVSSGEAANVKPAQEVPESPAHSRQTGRNIIDSRSTPGRPSATSDSPYPAPSASEATPKRPATSHAPSSVEPSTPSIFHRASNPSSRDYPQILPTSRVALRVTLWWCAFILTFFFLSC